MRVWYEGQWWTVTGSYWNHLYLRSDDGTETCAADDACHTSDDKGRDDPRGQTVRCETCGDDYGVGQWYRCPHGRGSLVVVPDGVPGGFVVENGFSQPTRFYSKSAHRAALDKAGLQLAPRHVDGGKLDRWV